MLTSQRWQFSIKMLLNSETFRNSSDYHEQLSAIMNDTRKETIDESEQKLKEIRQQCVFLRD